MRILVILASTLVLSAIGFVVYWTMAGNDGAHAAANPRAGAKHPASMPTSEGFGPGEHEGRPRPDFDRPRPPFELAPYERPGRGRWEMIARHRAGSLEAVVARTRAKNLAVSSGVLLLILLAGASLVRYTRESRP